MVAIHANPALPESTAAEQPSRPWNRLVREQWRQLLQSDSLPMRWARNADMSFSLHRTTTEPTIAYVVAQRLILRHWLLVFDEIQLLDVSSATLLADVLSWFWRMGGVIVGSSNKVPDDLYKNGVQRERLEPFVEALKTRCPAVQMRSERDWRAVRGGEGKRSWYCFDQRHEFEARLAEVAKGGGQTGSDGAYSSGSGHSDRRRRTCMFKQSLQKPLLPRLSSSDAKFACRGPRTGSASSHSLSSATR